MTGSTSSSCGACKFLRRKCCEECVFAPHFFYEHAATHFAAVHKVFGASNVSKMLLRLPVDRRSEAALTISYEALARVENPTYGCLSHIFALQQQVASLMEEIEDVERQIANNNACEGPEQQHMLMTTTTMNDLQFCSEYNNNNMSMDNMDKNVTVESYNYEDTTSYDCQTMNMQSLTMNNRWELDDVFFPFSDLNISGFSDETIIDPNFCLQYQLMDNRNIFN